MIYLVSIFFSGHFHISLDSCGHLHPMSWVTPIGLLQTFIEVHRTKLNHLKSVSQIMSLLSSTFSSGFPVPESKSQCPPKGA